MPTLTPLQRRALSAAAGVVGRPRLHAGLLLALSVACGPADPADPAGDDDASTGSDPATTTAATTGDPAVTTTGATDGAGTGVTTASSEATSDPGTSSGDLTTSGGTLLTDASTTTGATDTGETTGAPDTDATTGGLEDCVDPTTQEVDWACCEAQNWEPSPQCTPWGPPAPPAVDRDRLARARAARRGLLA